MKVGPIERAKALRCNGHLDPVSLKPSLRHTTFYIGAHAKLGEVWGSGLTSFTLRGLSMMLSILMPKYAGPEGQKNTQTSNKHQFETSHLVHSTRSTWKRG